MALILVSLIHPPQVLQNSALVYIFSGRRRINWHRRHCKHYVFRVCYKGPRQAPQYAGCWLCTLRTTFIILRKCLLPTGPWWLTSSDSRALIWTFCISRRMGGRVFRRGIVHVCHPEPTASSTPRTGVEGEVVAVGGDLRRLWMFLNSKTYAYLLWVRARMRASPHRDWWWWGEARINVGAANQLSISSEHSNIVCTMFTRRSSKGFAN